MEAAPFKFGFALASTAGENDKCDSNDAVALSVKEREKGSLGSPVELRRDQESTAATGNYTTANESSSNDESRINHGIIQRQFVIVNGISSLFRKRAETRMEYETVRLTVISNESKHEHDELEPLLRVSGCPQHNQDSHEEQPSANDIVRDLDRKQTDLIPGVYEGGLKVWECSLDLCRYLAQQLVQEDLCNDVQRATYGGGFILELGCGHGLPGCLLLREGLKRMYGNQAAPNVEHPFSVVFTDYNEFVLRDVTLSNVVLNCLPGAATDTAAWISNHVVLAAGDWMDLSQSLESGSLQEDMTREKKMPHVPVDGRFELILAAETTYTFQSARDTAILMSRHLALDTGVGLVATKRYYFGVGGGADAFREAAASIVIPPIISHRVNGDESVSYCLSVETLKVYDNGVGNIRELLRVKYVPSGPATL